MSEEEEVPEVQLERRDLLVSFMPRSLMGHWPEVQAARRGLPQPARGTDGYRDKWELESGFSIRATSLAEVGKRTKWKMGITAEA